jgi:acyl-coenzyme A synthetase/AMP-(fatty) acid ligase
MDLGKMDEDGFLYITGRKQEVMTVAGHTVHPRDVEEVLYKHPKVAELGVVGVPDPAGKD